MTFFLCCLYLLLMVALGYLLFSIIHRGPLTLAQLLGVVPALGAGTLGWLLFWLSLAGFAPSRLLLGAVGVVVFVGLLALARIHRLAPVNGSLLPQRLTKVETVIWLSIIFVLAVVLVSSLSVPLVEWDAFSIWGFKAKVLIHVALCPTPAYFHDFTLSYSHLDYPLMTPFLTAGAYAAMGSVNDQTGKLVSVFLDVLVVPLVFLGLRWKLPRLPALCLCLMLVLLPTFLRYAGCGCADLPLATFYSGSILFVVRWIELQKWEDLILVVLFSSFMAFTKNEGLVLALINGLVLLLFAARKRQLRAWQGVVFFGIGWLAVNAAWLIWHHHLPRTHEDYGAKLMSVYLWASLPKLKLVVWKMFLQSTAIHQWGWLWIMTGLLVALGWRAFWRPGVLALWVLLVLHLLAYALVYCVTPWNLDLLLATTLNRLLWHTIPAVFLLAGWHWAEIKTQSLSPP